MVIGKSVNFLLLLFTSSVLLVGAIANLSDHSSAAQIIWALGGIAGLFPAVAWLLASLRQKQMGSDILAVLALSGAILTNEMFAAAVIALMLATGRSLENWAEGQAERQLRSLLQRLPRLAHIMKEDGSIIEISADAIQVGDQLLVKSGEVIPADGALLSTAVLDESALTGEAMPVTRHETEMVRSGVLNAGTQFKLTASNTSQESTYAGIIRLVESAQARTALNS